MGRKATKYEDTNPVSTPRTVSAGIGRGTHKSIQRGSSGKQVVPKPSRETPKQK